MKFEASARNGLRLRPSRQAEHGFQYDPGGWLAGVTLGESGTPTYGFTSGHVGTVTTPDAQDRLSTFGATTYTYTANGERRTATTAGQTTTTTYDVLGNLTRVDLPDGRVITYRVDGRGRRVQKLVNGVAVLGWLWLDQLRVAAELDATGAVVSRFVYASRPNVPDYFVKNGITYRILADHLGSPRVVLDVASGLVVQRLDYDAFGQVTLDSHPGFQPLGFAGGLYDRDTGLTRFGARDYDARVGVWTAKDPIGFNGGDTNLYGYVMADPINFVDPSGLVCFDVDRFANSIERDRFDLAATLGTLAGAEVLGTMPKTPSELRGLGLPRSQLNPNTSQLNLSRWAGRAGIRGLREAGRTAAGVALGAVATSALVFEGFYDWGVIATSALDAISSGDCGCGSR